MNYVFWVFFTAEIGCVIWWFLDEMKLTYLEPNPFIYLSVVYLGLVALVKLVLKKTVLANVMVLVPGIPLLLLLSIIILAMATGAKWR